MTAERLVQLVEAVDAAIELLRREPRAGAVTQPMLERLAQAIRCEWAAYWVLDPQSQQLQSLSSWSALGLKGQRFEQETRVRTLSPNQGTVGQVWRSRKPIWTTNLVLEMSSPRLLDASESGLRGGVWFAVKTDTVIYGVIELLSRTTPYKTPESLAAVERVGFRLGYVIEELRSEQRSRLH
jgi:GAF domain-containing protein